MNTMYGAAKGELRSSWLLMLVLVMLFYAFAPQYSSAAMCPGGAKEHPVGSIQEALTKLRQISQTADDCSDQKVTFAKLGLSGAVCLATTKSCTAAEQKTKSCATSKQGGAFTIVIPPELGGQTVRISKCSKSLINKTLNDIAGGKDPKSALDALIASGQKSGGADATQDGNLTDTLGQGLDAQTQRLLWDAQQRDSDAAARLLAALKAGDQKTADEIARGLGLTAGDQRKLKGGIEKLGGSQDVNDPAAATNPPTAEDATGKYGPGNNDRFGMQQDWKPPMQSSPPSMAGGAPMMMGTQGGGNPLGGILDALKNMLGLGKQDQNQPKQPGTTQPPTSSVKDPGKTPGDTSQFNKTGTAAEEVEPRVGIRAKKVDDTTIKVFWATTNVPEDNTCRVTDQTDTEVGQGTIGKEYIEIPTDFQGDMTFTLNCGEYQGEELAGEASVGI